MRPVRCGHVQHRAGRQVVLQLPVLSCRNMEQCNRSQRVCSMQTLRPWSVQPFARLYVVSAVQRRLLQRQFRCSGVRGVSARNVQSDAWCELIGHVHSLRRRDIWAWDRCLVGCIVLSVRCGHVQHLGRSHSIFMRLLSCRNMEQCNRSQRVCSMQTLRPWSVQPFARLYVVSAVQRRLLQRQFRCSGVRGVSFWYFHEQHGIKQRQCLHRLPGWNIQPQHRIRQLKCMHSLWTGPLQSEHWSGCLHFMWPRHLQPDSRSIQRQRLR